MVDVRIEQLRCQPTWEAPIEIVERKGIGHPDSICDGIMEHAAVLLAQAYRQQFGQVVHYNLDKGLLAAGSAERWFGGGKLVEPMRLIFGDRATFEWHGIAIPVFEIVRQAADEWLRRNLPRVNPEHDIVYQSELRAGSPELALTALGPVGSAPANDTSAAVGYAPLTATERIVMAAERYLNGQDFKSQFPDTGEDVKAMAFRVESNLRLTVAMPFLAPYITSEDQYFRRKQEASGALMAHLDSLAFRPASLELELNSLDVPGNQAAGTYLSVLGTSAEDGDSGEVGRGNRVNGLISLNRPASAEAAAGKNPISHVGKLYNILCFQLAQRIFDQVAGVREVYVWLGSQIGQPVNDPPMAAVQLSLAPGQPFAPSRNLARTIVLDGLAHLDDLIEGLINGTTRIY